MTAASHTVKERTGKWLVIDISRKCKRIGQPPRDRSPPLLCQNLVERHLAPGLVPCRTGEKAQTSRERRRSELVKRSEMGANQTFFLVLTKKVAFEATFFCFDQEHQLSRRIIESLRHT
jgi:hypothetical protein